jgi:hypothetical protein
MTTRFEEEVMENGPFQGHMIGKEVTKEVLVTRMGRKV